MIFSNQIDAPWDQESNNIERRRILGCNEVQHYNFKLVGKLIKSKYLDKLYFIDKDMNPTLKLLWKELHYKYD